MLLVKAGLLNTSIVVEVVGGREQDEAVTVTLVMALAGLATNSISFCLLCAGQKITQ